MAKLTEKARRKLREKVGSTPQKGEPGYRPETKRAAVPLEMVQPACQRKGCGNEARFVPVMVISSEPMAWPEEWESRAPMPSGALCATHRDELERHPDMMLTEAAWENINIECLRKGRALPDRGRLRWEFEEIPTYEELEAKVGELRARAARIALARDLTVH